MKRGDIVLVALPGDYGKPRPAVVIQSDAYNDTHPSVCVCPVSATLHDASALRITLEPSPLNGLERVSQIAVDKPQTPRRERIKECIGGLTEDELHRLERALLMFLGFSDAPHS